MASLSLKWCLVPSFTKELSRPPAAIRFKITAKKNNGEENDFLKIEYQLKKTMEEIRKNKLEPKIGDGGKWDAAWDMHVTIFLTGLLEARCSSDPMKSLENFFPSESQKIRNMYLGFIQALDLDKFPEENVTTQNKLILDSAMRALWGANEIGDPKWDEHIKKLLGTLLDSRCSPNPAEDLELKFPHVGREIRSVFLQFLEIMEATRKNDEEGEESR